MHSLDYFVLRNNYTLFKEILIVIFKYYKLISYIIKESLIFYKIRSINKFIHKKFVTNG